MIQYCKEFFPKMRHVAGTENSVADWLSRPPQREDKQAVGEFSPKDATDLVTDQSGHPSVADRTKQSSFSDQTEHLPVLTALQTHHTPPHSLDFSTFAHFQSQDGALLAHLDELSDKSNSDLTVVTKQVDGTTVYGVSSSESGSFRPAVPEALRPSVFHTLHSTVHQGQEKSVETIASRFYWPKMAEEISAWVKNCPLCQSCKVSRHNRQALHNFPGNYGRFNTVHLDLVGPLPPSDGYRYILTMRDRGTGLLVAAPLPDKTSSAMAEAFVSHFLGHYGVPATVISDNGREFVSQLFEELCCTLGIRHKTTTAYHPQSNGALERIHRQLKTAFRALSDPASWSHHLPYVILALNNMRCDINQYTAFQHAFGQPANLPGSLLFPEEDDGREVRNVDTAVFFDLMAHHKKEARPLRDNRPHIEEALSSCSRVWVKNEAPSHSLSPLYTGPHVVLSRENKYFTLDMGSRVSKVSIDRLKAFHGAIESCETPYQTSDPDGDRFGDLEEGVLPLAAETRFPRGRLRDLPRRDYAAMNG